MFAHAEEAAKFSMTQPESSSSSISDIRNQPPLVGPSTLAINDNHSLSSKKAITWRVLNTTIIDGKKYALFGSDNLKTPIKSIQI
jgi:hypothetical protein